MWTAIFTLWTALSTAAAAAPAGHEANLDLGSIGISDPSWAMFSQDPMIGNFGVRGGVQVAPWTRIIAGWNHGTRGQELTLLDSSSSLPIGQLHTAATIDQYSLGTKIVWDTWPWIHPYATAQGVLFVGHVRMDDDITITDNDNELRYGAVAPGLMGTLGAEVLLLGKDKPVRMAFSLEFGYGHSWPLRFKGKDKQPQLGELTINGLVSRLGVGVRF